MSEVIIVTVDGANAEHVLTSYMVVEVSRSYATKQLSRMRKLSNVDIDNLHSITCWGMPDRLVCAAEVLLTPIGVKGSSENAYTILVEEEQNYAVVESDFDSIQYDPVVDWGEKIARPMEVIQDFSMHWSVLENYNRIKSSAVPEGLFELIASGKTISS